MNRLVLLLVSSVTVSAGVIQERAAFPFFYFAFGDSYTTTSFNIYGEQPSLSSPLGNPPLGQGTYIPSFFDQVSYFFEPKYSSPHVAQWGSEDTIASVFFGINDCAVSYNLGIPGFVPAKTRVPQLMAAYFSLLDNLYSQGLRRFMLINIPPVDRSPLVLGFNDVQQAGLRNYYKVYNKALQNGVKTWLRTHKDAYISLFDYNQWLTNVLDNPSDYGFPDSTCIDPSGQNCIWWNDYHVGSRLNDFLAQRLVVAMNALGYNGGIPVSGNYV
ncbi:hypothetical protein IFR05_010111 [Cadophora sp. M221]|nr:hypothetical protein IFR05_010111 [Cadophora sp. M221]